MIPVAFEMATVVGFWFYARQLHRAGRQRTATGVRLGAVVWPVTASLLVAWVLAGSSQLTFPP